VVAVTELGGRSAEARPGALEAAREVLAELEDRL
jgi:hypothetical protein